MTAKTGAERQRDYRTRRARLLARLRADNARLLEENAGLLAEVDRLRGLACRHPAGAVDGGTCRACGAEVW